ncbi:hypothetical protein N7486_000850 [Penicillium sp. IBT 16267x]|nr:hypothetical protein N7486_000850 [Penicillium sp. IBT 16267x]
MGELNCILGRQKKSPSPQGLFDKKASNTDGKCQSAGTGWIPGDKAEDVEFPIAVFSSNVASYSILGGLRCEVEASDLVKWCDDVSVGSTDLVAAKAEDIVHYLTPDLGWE